MLQQKVKKLESLRKDEQIRKMSECVVGGREDSGCVAGAGESGREQGFRV